MWPTAADRVDMRQRHTPAARYSLSRLVGSETNVVLSRLLPQIASNRAGGQMAPTPERQSVTQTLSSCCPALNFVLAEACAAIMYASAM